MEGVDISDAAVLAQGAQLVCCQAEAVTFIAFTQVDGVANLCGVAIVDGEHQGEGAVDEVVAVNYMEYIGTRLVEGEAVELEVLARRGDEGVVDGDEVGLAEDRVAAVGILEVAAPGVVDTCRVVVANPSVEGSGQIRVAVHTFGEQYIVAPTLEGGRLLRSCTQIEAHHILCHTVDIVAVADTDVIVDEAGNTTNKTIVLVVVGNTVDIVVVHLYILGIADETAHALRCAGRDKACVVVVEDSSVVGLVHHNGTLAVADNSTDVEGRQFRDVDISEVLSTVVSYGVNTFEEAEEATGIDGVTESTNLTCSASTFHQTQLTANQRRVDHMRDETANGVFAEDGASLNGDILDEGVLCCLADNSRDVGVTADHSGVDNEVLDGGTPRLTEHTDKRESGLIDKDVGDVLAVAVKDTFERVVGVTKRRPLVG